MQNAVESGIYGVLLKVAELQFFVLSWGCFRLNVASFTDPYFSFLFFLFYLREIEQIF